MNVAARSIDELIAGLADPDGNQRSKALGELSLLGRAAVPALTAALGHPDVEVRAQAMIALAFIADPSSVETFAAHVADADGRIRGNAANGLAQLRDPRAHHEVYFALVRQIVQAAPSTWGYVEDINNQILTGNLYKALKESRKLIEYETELLEHAKRGAGLRKRSKADLQPA